MKKISILLLVFLSALTLVGCKKEEKTETIPPAFADAIGGFLPKVEHLAGEEVDLLSGIKVIDNETASADIKVEITDMAGYDKDVFGNYVIEYTATDKAGNSSKAKRQIEVFETYTTVLEAILINDKFMKYSLNDPEAFSNIGDNAKFRLNSEVIHVMDKDFFLDQITVHAAAWPKNEGIPSFAWGSLVVIDNEGKLMQARYAHGAQMEMDKEGNLKYSADDLVWFTSNGAGNLLKGLDKALLDELIPEGGRILLAAANTVPNPDSARIFIGQNTFWTDYQGGGGMVKDVKDVETSTIKFTFDPEYKVTIKKPPLLATPELKVERHVLTWGEVAGARGYNLYVNGEKKNEDLITSRRIELLNLDYLIVSNKYEIEVDAVALDEFKNSNSLKSEKLVYDRIEIITQEKPVLTYDEEAKVINFTRPEGSEEINAYGIINGSAFRLELGTVEGTSFNPHELAKDYPGVVGFYLISTGSNEYSDSQSDVVKVTIAQKEAKITVNGMEALVLKMNATNYFARRNETADYKLSVGLFLVSDVKDFSNKYITPADANGTVIVISPDNKVKLVRTIVGNNAWTEDKGWHTDAVNHASNLQMKDISKYMDEGDMLLIGRTSGSFDISVNGTPKKVTTRDFLAWNFQVTWADIAVSPVAPNGWRGTVDTFNVKPNEVVFTIK